MDLLKTDKNCITVYLNSSINTLTNRIYKEKSKRPLISHLTTKEELKDFIAKHLFERSFYYNQSSNKVITDGLSVEGVVSEIMKEIKE